MDFPEEHYQALRDSNGNTVIRCSASYETSRDKFLLGLLLLLCTYCFALHFDLGGDRSFQKSPFPTIALFGILGTALGFKIASAASLFKKRALYLSAAGVELRRGFRISSLKKEEFFPSSQISSVKIYRSSPYIGSNSTYEVRISQRDSYIPMALGKSQDAQAVSKAANLIAATTGADLIDAQGDVVTPVVFPPGANNTTNLQIFPRNYRLTREKTRWRDQRDGMVTLGSTSSAALGLAYTLLLAGVSFLIGLMVVEQRGDLSDPSNAYLWPLFLVFFITPHLFLCRAWPYFCRTSFYLLSDTHFYEIQVDNADKSYQVMLEIPFTEIRAIQMRKVIFDNGEGSTAHRDQALIASTQHGKFDLGYVSTTPFVAHGFLKQLHKRLGVPILGTQGEDLTDEWTRKAR